MKFPQKTIWKQELSFSHLDTVCQRLHEEFKALDFFCLWLIGDLGAGKTTLTAHYLRSLGLSSQTPVHSPTFTYLNDYKIGAKTYAHLDFYRLEEGEHSSVTDLLSFFDYDGLFIEWPQKIKDLDLIRPTHILEIQAGDTPSTRTYILSKC